MHQIFKNKRPPPIFPTLLTQAAVVERWEAQLQVRVTHIGVILIWPGGRITSPRVEIWMLRPRNYSSSGLGIEYFLPCLPMFSCCCRCCFLLFIYLFIFVLVLFLFVCLFFFFVFISFVDKIWTFVRKTKIAAGKLINLKIQNFLRHGLFPIVKSPLHFDHIDSLCSYCWFVNPLLQYQFFLFCYGGPCKVCLFPRRTCRLLQNKFQEQRLYSDDLPLLLWPTSFPGSLFFRDPVSRWREEGRPWVRGCVVTFTLKNILFKNQTVFFLRGQQNIKPKLMTEKKKHSYVGV